MEPLLLLDTPKRLSLTSQSTDLRATLKEWEKSFAASHQGHKPGKDDIKADADAAKRYKEYNRLRDVLAGRLSLHEYEHRASPSRRADKRTQVGHTPSRPKLASIALPESPRGGLHDQYDAPLSASKNGLLTAIGPTPQRDGKVLGLFDLLPSSGTSGGTPSSRKRKVDALHPPIELEPPSKCTPTHRTRDVHQPEIIPPINPSDQNTARHSRTPATESKKAMLAQFLSTPSTLRFTSLLPSPQIASQLPHTTPLRDSVLKYTPTRDNVTCNTKIEGTPAYLRRSLSFKDRLLSATSVNSEPNQEQPTSSYSNLRHRPRRALARKPSMPKPLSQIVQDLRDLEDGDVDDDLDALREAEAGMDQCQALDDQPPQYEQSAGDSKENLDPMANKEQMPQRIWKKKGQKRTTKKSNIRPSVLNASSAPKFVASDDEADELNGSDDQKRSAAASSRRPSTKQKGNSGPKSATVNPNALVHMNFRSLKIKNKNSKAKGGGRFGGRFGRGRR